MRSSTESLVQLVSQGLPTFLQGLSLIYVDQGTIWRLNQPDGGPSGMACLYLGIQGAENVKLLLSLGDPVGGKTSAVLRNSIPTATPRHHVAVDHHGSKKSLREAIDQMGRVRGTDGPAKFSADNGSVLSVHLLSVLCPSGRWPPSRTSSRGIYSIVLSGKAYTVVVDEQKRAAGDKVEKIILLQVERKQK
ncbi:unnamed protein product [Strongylus vulgaris]|uniref:Uncharacterized protein n=1 Tax=Strongylus vulgaris TaxID=40348 RepID=A0A3P7LIN9_STRVU|nr:unnamed protein product [Strongylus vulgaris]